MAVDTSQHGEVAVLRELIGSEFPRSLVDVGAHDGARSSNSRPFIEEGWSALLIEPLPKPFALLAASHRDNKRVTCLNVACADFRGKAPLFLGADGDEGFLASICSDENGWFHGRHSARAITVTVETLTHVLGARSWPADFGLLLVDAEGVDHEVLVGLDPARFRPRVIVTEEYAWNAAKHLAKYDLLRERGYRLWAAVGCNTVWLRTDLWESQGDDGPGAAGASPPGQVAVSPEPGAVAGSDRRAAIAGSRPREREPTPAIARCHPTRCMVIYDGRSHGGQIGYFSHFLGILGWLERCLVEGYVPVVDYHNPANLYADSSDPLSNQWEHFFHPVSGVSLAEVLAMEEAGRASVVWRGHYEGPHHNAAVDTASRRRFGRVISAYVRPKDHLLDKVDRYWWRELRGRAPGRVLGVHARRTDKPRELCFDVSLGQYWRSIERYLDRNPSALIYLATDDQETADAFRARYPDRLLLNPTVYRSIDGRPVHKSAPIAPFKKAEDALVECLSLARCDHLIRAPSNLSHAALFFNPDMTHTLLCPTGVGGVAWYARQYRKRSRRAIARGARAVLGDELVGRMKDVRDRYLAVPERWRVE